MADTKKTATKRTVTKKTVAKTVKAPAKKTASKAASNAAKGPVAKAAPKKIVTKSTSNVAKASSVAVDLFDTAGKKSSTLSLPAALFEAKINKQLMAQAVRVYLANQRSGTASTKSRGEVQGSTRKIYRQKGTGRARHGGIRAPIFVGGGVALGPKPHDFTLSLTKKMKKAALFSALSARQKEGQIKAVTGLETLAGKTKDFANLLLKLELGETKILLVMPEKIESVVRGARNIKGIRLTPVQGLNTYDVLNAKTVVLMKDAVAAMEKHFTEAK